MNEPNERPRFELSIAQTREDVLDSQRLRYRVFAGELGAAIDGRFCASCARGTCTSLCCGGEFGVDHDQFDPFCRHLLVRETSTRKIVACTRVLSCDAAPNAGGFYSESEFDLAMLDSLPGRVMEVGRTCVDAEYRNGAVIATLWQGLAALVTAEGFDYLFGCASIGLDDGGAAAHAILKQLREQHLAAPARRVRPFIPLPAPDGGPATRTRMPPLLKAYLSLGARACGEAYWDRDFNCADVFMLLDVRDLNPRYARHFAIAPRAESELAIAA
jgi:putative hemolysin